ncbi:amino acid deaminase/aldolase [Streptomyces johnsoniae]|uniref:Amino acid deaminase/aldolase n=1 Tax=Streptomyces johnsoniae TaxID=3075532 RepID=A0ABU2RZV3_9ACTN|nr:amino acid deaminase/aldolase [Streptomyces sp. DSM 41886]MDT0442257.1 amino acid deaminase/aldolase [Streptomyces sp. DSM 41886]
MNAPTASGLTALPGLARATAALEPPFAVVDLAAFRANADALTRRALGKPVRVASKSLRCAGLLNEAGRQPGFRGVLAYTLAEALWLAEKDEAGGGDIVVAYPTADRSALRRLADEEHLARRVTLMVDSEEHLEFLRSAAAPVPERPLRLCLELDVSLRLFGGRVHIGARRSPVRGPADALALARAVAGRPGFRLVGMMAYESQIAGIGDAPPGAPLRGLAVRAMQRGSAAELAGRRAAAVAAVRSVADLEFVNGGGTGSVERTAAEPAVTEIAAGSGLYGPVLFDAYRGFRPRPAAYFVLPVVRRPGRAVATVLGGGWVASGVPGWDRLPRPAFPAGLSYRRLEGAGEVQTPLTGRAADGLGIGDRVWFRHAKAGELAEHVNVFHLVAGDRLVGEMPTYRGEGFAFL